jgi:hypothetical protein
MDVEIEKV